MNNIFDKQNRELKQKIKSFEKNNGSIEDYVFKQNEPFLHSMKMKEEILKNLDIDAEFENADLLDYLGYERIISCNKQTKK